MVVNPEACGGLVPSARGLNMWHRGRPRIQALEALNADRQG